MKLTIEDIAKVTHEANRAYCAAINDHSQCSWEDSPPWQKDSAIHGIQFHASNPHASPAESHGDWLAIKLREGWKYGPTKDPAKKEHPCCVPYDEMPLEQKRKDALYSAVVAALLPALA